MTITTDQAVALAREVGANYWHHGMNTDQLTALCNKVREQALLEAAKWVDDNTEITGNGWSCHLRRMAVEN